MEHFEELLWLQIGLWNISHWPCLGTELHLGVPVVLGAGDRLQQ